MIICKEISAHLIKEKERIYKNNRLIGERVSGYYVIHAVWATQTNQTVLYTIAVVKSLKKIKYIIYENTAPTTGYKQDNQFQFENCNQIR